MNSGPVVSNDSIGAQPGRPDAIASDTSATGAGSCPQCGSAPGHARSQPSASWVYAIGQIAPRVPDVGVEKELAQAGAGGSGGVLETNRLMDLLKQQEFQYLARQLCWVFHNGETETFAIECRDKADAERLVNAMPRAEAADQTIQVIVGSTVPAAGDTACAAVGLPTVAMDHHLTFTVASFIDALGAAPKGSTAKGDQSGAGKPDEAFRETARDLFARLTRRSDNRGMSDDHRALNYIALRYPALYRLAADARREDKALLDVHVRRMPSGSRRLVAVRLVFRGRRTDVVERFQCVVDVTDRFPFLSTSLSQVYD